MSNGSSFTARLFGICLACAVLLVVGVIGPSWADNGCRLAGVTVATGSEPEAVLLNVEGSPEYKVVPLEKDGGLTIAISNCELADGFQLPSLAPESSISQIEYRLSLLAGVQSVELTIHMKPGKYTGYSIDTSVQGTLRVDLAPKPAVAPAPKMPGNVVEEVQVKHYGPRAGDPDALYQVQSINVEPISDGEKVVVALDKASAPELRQFTYPTRLTLEIQGGYLADSLGDFVYNSKNGLVRKVDVLFSPQHKAGVFQLIITCPEMGSYDMTQEGGTYTINLHKSNTPIAPVNPAVANPVVDNPAPKPPVEVPAADTPQAQPAPADPTPPAPTEQSGYGGDNGGAAPAEPTQPTQPTEPASKFKEYPDVPVQASQEQPGTYQFPETGTTANNRHVSDSIVSLNVDMAQFVDVLRILTEQAGVNFVLDAYWNIAPTGFVREGFRPPGGPGASGGGGSFGGGGNFGPRDRSYSMGSVTMHITEVPFDTAFGLLMQANNLDYRVFRYTPDSDPILFISSRERIEQELGLGSIQIYHLNYIDVNDALAFLTSMDLMPTTSGYGFWVYGGGGSGSGNNGGGGGNSGGNRGGGGGNRGGGGGGGRYGGAPMPGGFDAASIGVNPGGASPMQLGGGGGVGGGGGGVGGGGGIGGGGGGNQGGGGNNGGGGGFLPTAKVGAIGIIATAETHQKIREALLEIDKPPKMVIVESTFLTYKQGDPNNRPTVYGLGQIGDWAFEIGGDRFRGAFDTTGTEGLVFEILPKNQRMPFQDFRALWQYVFTQRDAKIIASPRVAVIDGFSATVAVTENWPFIINGGVILDQFGNVIPAPDQVTYIPIGTTLTIQPFIDDYGNCTMFMQPTNNQMLAPPQLIDGNLVFGTSQAQVTTYLRMRDGETIMLGGLRTRIKDVTKNQIPFLGDLPIIGPLFGRTTISESNSNLVIVMTIHLVGA